MLPPELQEVYEPRPPEIVTGERKEYEKSLVAANLEGLSICQLNVISVTRAVEQWLESLGDDVIHLQEMHKNAEEC